MEQAIAIITARGGSKRIPRKNIKDFCGRPIIEYSIETAIKSEIFDEVMVSTDDEEIAKIAKAAGAQVPFYRSDNASSDFAITADVVREVIETYHEMGRDFQYGCCIYPTAPFITVDELRNSIDILKKDTDLYSVMPVVPFSFPPQRGMISDGKEIRFWFPDKQNMRSQELETIYHDCGQFYTFRVDKFLEIGSMWGEAVAPMIKDELHVQDIDNESDWQIAEIKYQYLTKGVPS